MKIETLMKVLWFAHPLTKLAYLFIAGQWVGAGESGGLSVGTATILALLGVAEATAGGLLGWFLFRSARLRAVLARFFKNRSDAAGSGFFGAWIVALGLAETASLYGFVIAVSTGGLRNLVAMVACTTLAWAFSYPRLDLAASLEAPDKTKTQP